MILWRFITTKTVSDESSDFKKLLDDYITQKSDSLIRLKKGTMSREDFLDEAYEYLRLHFYLNDNELDELFAAFREYIFGYSKLSALIDNPEISDIRVISYNNIRIKRRGKREKTAISFESAEEYRRFIDYIATKNQVNISNLNAIQRFTDNDSHKDFILRFTLSMPLVNTYDEPYLCIRKVPRTFPLITDLVREGMLSKKLAETLILRFRQGSTLICGGNSSGKTTLLNALKESLPDNMAVLVTQQADELTTRFHPDMMFLHSLPHTAESKVDYDLKQISIAGLTMDVDFFIIGEIKGGEAYYLLNAACTGQICAATIHATSARSAPDKLVDYCMYESRYLRDELMRMLDCFKTIVFMKDYRVSEVYSADGYDEVNKCLRLERMAENGQLV